MDSMFSSHIREHGCIPWDDNYMKIGSGYDLHKQQSLRSPFWPCHPSSELPSTGLHTLEISSKILRDEETLLQYMTSDTRALASVFTVFNLKASLEALKTAQFVVVGCSSRNLQHQLHKIDIQKAWVNFLEHYTPIPVLAHITHYANIDIRIKHPEGSLSITEDFRNAAELAQLLQVVARSNRLVGARALEISVQSTILKLADLHVYAEDDDKALQQCVATLKNVREELRGVWDRRQKLAKMMTETEDQTEKWKL
ncbi:unnamed protein product [Alternaria alternata]